MLYQQPILDVRTNEIARHELLLRMIGDDGEHVAPATFLYIAERFGLVQEIDAGSSAGPSSSSRSRRSAGAAWTSRSICGPVADEPGGHRDDRVRARGVPDRPVLPDVRDHRDGRDREHPEGPRFAERIAELGCGFALDDFGAGFGSFYYLKHLPFDVLKIDGEFVRNLTDSVKDQAVVRSLARIATELGKQTVAEFVEDAETLALVRRYGVDFAQGFHIGLPQPVSAWLGHALPVS